MAKLNGIILENFKAFKTRQVIPIRPLTLIYGPNSAGKSSIIHALALLKHAFLNHGHAEADCVDLEWSEVRLGSWQNLVHGHNRDSTFKIGLQFVADRTPRTIPCEGTDQWEIVWEFGRPNENYAATVTVISAVRNGQPEFDGTWNHVKQCWSLTRYANSLHSERFSAERFLGAYQEQGGLFLTEESKSSILRWLVALDHITLDIAGLFPNSVVERESAWDEYYAGAPSDVADLFLRHLFDPQPADRYSYNDGRDWTDIQVHLLSGIEKIKTGTHTTDEETNSLRQVYVHWSSLITASEPPYDAAALSFEAIIQNHFHLDSVRERPKFDLNLRDLPNDPKYRLWKRLLTNESLREQAGSELETLTRQPGLTAGYHLAMRNRIVEISGNENSQSIKSITPELAILNPQGLLLGIEDVGYGVSTVLPIVTAINHKEKCIISVEQPELHIHPRLQTELGELFLKSSLEKANHLLVETHSEHLVLRILRRIRETTAGEMEVWPEALCRACPQGIRIEDVAVLYVQPGENGSEVIELPITPDGDFARPWPFGFFTERSKELY